MSTTDIGAGGAGAPPMGAAPTTVVNGVQSSDGGNAAAQAQATAASQPDWTSTLKDDVKGYVQNKGFKDPAMVVDSYRNLEKLMGAGPDKLVRIPDKADDPAWNDVYGKLGRPKEASEYKFEVPPGGDPKLAEWAKSQFHQLGLTKAQGEKFAEQWNKYAMEIGTQIEQHQKAQAVEQHNKLKQEWGMAFDQNVSKAKAAVQAFGIDDATLDKLESAMGFEGLMKFAHSLGTKIGEDGFVSSQGNNKFGNHLSPEEAKFKIKELSKDKSWAAKYAQGDFEAKQEFERLHKYAFPDIM